MIDYSLILAKFFEDKQWSINGTDYDGIEWMDVSKKPTKDELDALWDSTQKHLSFIYNRRSAYPSIQDQLDTLYHQGYDGWKATIDSVKQQYPKP